MANVIIVVDPEYGDRLEAVAQLAPLWVVDTQINKKAFERLWKARPHADHRETGALTSYKTPNPEDRVRSLLGIVPELETHHGEVEEDELVFPNGFVLRVIGLAMAADVARPLRDLGFRSFIETSEGFEARK
jgi:hypothetical protein